MTAAKSAPGHGPKLTVVEGTQVGSPGQRLMRARSLRNLALEDVSRHLNLSVSMVKAIESDNFKSLPGRAFVRGYLRNYAKLVGVEADDLMRAYDSQFGASDEVSLNPPEVSRPPRWIAPLIKGLGYLVLVAVLAGIGTIIYQNAGTLANKAQQLSSSFQHDEQMGPETDAPAAPAATEAKEGDTVRLSIPLRPVEGAASAPDAAGNPSATSTPATAESPVTAPAEPASKSETDTVPPQSSVESGVSTASAANVSNAPPQPVAIAAPPSVEATSAAAGQTQNFVAGGTSVDNVGISGSDAASVSLVFSGLSWARVRDANDKILFDGTRSAGAEIQLQGVAPFTIRLGNAPVVKVTFNGKPRDFDFSSRSNVAQFKLGEE